MCLIIDANCAWELSNGAPDATPIATWLKRGDSRIAIGGTKLNIEYKKIGNFMKLLGVLDSRGQIHRAEEHLVDREAERIESELILTSDDPHILALAIVSGARIIYSHDSNLHTDFCNQHIIAKPQGKIYQNKNHAHLLIDALPCRR
jgi:hypothetical protein